MAETPEVTHTTPTAIEPPKNTILEGLKDHFEEDEAEQAEVDESADAIEEGLLNGEIGEEDLQEAFPERPSPEQLYYNMQQALREERAERQEAVERARQEAAQEAYQAFMQAQQEQALMQAWQQANPPIDVNEDPIGYFNQKLEQQNMVLQAQQQAMQAYAEQQQTQQQIASLQSTVAADEAQFVAQYPDYETNPDGSEGGALGHWRASRAQELQMIFPNATEEQIANTIFNDEAQYSHHAMQMGYSPAAYFYQMAINRGYQPGQGYDGEEEGYDLPPRGSDGRFMAREDMEDLREEGMRYSQSLSGAGRPSDQSVEAMLHMDTDDFKKAWAKMKKTKGSSIFR